MKVTAYGIAERFIGLQEIPGHTSNPQILAMLQLDTDWPKDDEVPWCSAFVNYISFLLGLPRPKSWLSLRARAWLNVGKPISFGDAIRGFDVVILSRGINSPPATVIDAPGHVGFFSKSDDVGNIYILGGNQNNEVNITPYRVTRMLGVRRLWIAQSIVT